MIQKTAQIELAVIKGLAIALAILGVFAVYESISAKTTDGINIECRWDCSNAQQSNCVDGHVYRDISGCVPNNVKCWESEPKPSSVLNCP